MTEVWCRIILEVKRIVQLFVYFRTHTTTSLSEGREAKISLNNSVLIFKKPVCHLIHSFS